MGKVKTVIMGDEQAEEKARAKATAKREQKKAEKALTKKEKQSEELKENIVVNEEILVASEGPNQENDSPKPAKNPKNKLVKSDKFSKHQTGKKYAAAVSLVDKNKTYSLSDALDLVKKTSFSKFDGSVELHLNVSDKGLRGIVSLPHGTGKQVRVKIADDKLIDGLSKGEKIDFDILVSSPDMMPKLARVAKILGPKGLMPNPKTGTIGPDPEKLAKQLGGGQVQWKTQNDFPIVHSVIGKVSFESKKLEENYTALTKSIGRDKIRSVFVKATMGPAIQITA